jgi:hypothetical protein
MRQKQQQQSGFNDNLQQLRVNTGRPQMVTLNVLIFCENKRSKKYLKEIIKKYVSHSFDHF